METKKQLKQKLEEANQDKLYYKSKVDMIEYKLRNQRETNGNVFTLLREINKIIYPEVF